MSKRGTNSAKFIGGKDWKNGHTGNDINKKLQLLRNKNRNKLLNDKFNNASISFNIPHDDIAFSNVRHQIRKEENKNKQALFFKNITAFKDFSAKNAIEFSIEKYFDEKYYLKDFSGVLDSEYGLLNLSIKELMEIKLKTKSIKRETGINAYRAKAHIEFLIFQKSRQV